jgi:hypothetical protein
VVAGQRGPSRTVPSCRASTRAAARVIAGRVKPHGKLPVAVQRPDDPEQVLYPIGYGLSY